MFDPDPYGEKRIKGWTTHITALMLFNTLHPEQFIRVAQPSLVDNIDGFPAFSKGSGLYAAFGLAVKKLRPL